MVNINSLKIKTVKTLYALLNSCVWLANWYLNGRKKIIAEDGCLEETNEFMQFHSVEKCIQELDTANVILNELRIRREIE